MEYPWAMVQINDGLTCVTAHKTEDDAYNDIIDTCLEAPEWIGGSFDDILELCDENEVVNAETDQDQTDLAIQKLVEIRKAMSPEDFYLEWLVDRFEGISEGFYMEVCPLLEVEA